MGSGNELGRIKITSMKHTRLFAVLTAVLVFAPTLTLAQITKTPTTSSGETPSYGIEHTLLTEKINDFHSDITVHEDGSLTVQETIAVTATGDEIQHGIYRDFPTIYPNSIYSFLRTTTEFDVISVTKNGKNEPYTMAKMSNGKRIYIGDAETLIPPGDYTYTITYTTAHQLYFDQEFDELFWNVTGNGWSFPIEHASATLHLPGDLAKGDSIALDGFTGPQYSEEKNFTAEVKKKGTVVFETTEELLPYEGFSIITQFPKGYVQPENTLSLQKIVADNPEIILTLVAILYYFLLWFTLGRDPNKGTVIPQYEPPRGLSPAAVRYILRMSPNTQDKRAVAAAIISMGVKGHIELTKEGELYTLHKKAHAKKQIPLSADEETLFNGLFAQEDSIELKQTNHLHLSIAIDSFGDVLRDAYKKENFSTHVGYWVLGALLSSAAVVLPLIMFHSITVGTGVLGTILFIFIIVFYFLLKSPTREGQKLRTEIEGFKWFLSVTEKERLAFNHPPKKTPELFEQFLPYALALGVENKWAQQFADVFAQMEAAGKTSPGVGWYSGMSLYAFASGNELSSFGSSFTSTISSSAAAPSSGGGGGFSGGGGGGGGGGGW